MMFMGCCFELGNLCIVMEYCGNGNLGQFIQQKATMLDWVMRARIATEIAMAMQYLHSRTPIIIHRDLTPTNILVRCVDLLFLNFSHSSA